MPPPNDGAPPGGMDPAVHLFLSQAFGRLSGQVADAITSANQAATASREAGARLTVLEWHVFGSLPPPKLDELVKSGKVPSTATSVVGRVSLNEIETDAAAAEVILQAGRLARVEAKLDAQSAVMGLPVQVREADAVDRWAAFIMSRAGRSFVLKILTLIVTVLGLAASMRASSSAKDTADKVNAAPVAAPLHGR